MQKPKEHFCPECGFEEGMPHISFCKLRKKLGLEEYALVTREHTDLTLQRLNEILERKEAAND